MNLNPTGPQRTPEPVPQATNHVSRLSLQHSRSIHGPQSGTIPQESRIWWARPSGAGLSISV